MKDFGTKVGRRHNASASLAANIRQTGTPVTGDQHVDLRNLGHREKKSIVRIGDLGIGWLENFRQLCPVQIIDQDSDSMALENALESRIAAGASNFIDLLGAMIWSQAGHKSPDSPFSAVFSNANLPR